MLKSINKLFKTAIIIALPLGIGLGGCIGEKVPNELLTVISEDEANNLIIEKGYYEVNRNPEGSGLENQFEQIANGEVVYDRATGLYWQQAGSNNIMFHNTDDYRAKINSQKLGGYNDWRLPTLEEAMSLMEPTEKNSGFIRLHIDPVFDRTQRWTWTSSILSEDRVWNVNYQAGDCHVGGTVFLSFSPVRLVRKKL